MIISVHIPRTAGSSFRAYLRQHPHIRLVEDYGDPILVPSIIRNNYARFGKKKTISTETVDCLHGHFLPFKYRTFIDQPDVHFITWLRDPAQRLLSQYHFCFLSDKKVDKSPFQNRVVREEWTFEQFYSHPRLRNLYAKFFWGFPIDQFEFIGIVEHYEEDFAFICRHYFHDKRPVSVYANRTGNAEVSEEDEKRIRVLHAEDYKIYEDALIRRAHRKEQTVSN